MAVSVALSAASRGHVSSKPRDCIRIEDKIYCETQQETSQETTPIRLPNGPIDSVQGGPIIAGVLFTIILVMLVLIIATVFTETKSPTKEKL